MHIVLIGAGNMGTHLGKALHQAGHKIVQVFSRTRPRAEKLAKLLGTSYTTQLHRISDEADLYIVAIHDDGIAGLAENLSSRLSDKLIVHTSGATASTVFDGYFERFGAFYPLQTMTVGKAVDFTTLPICIDAKKPADADGLFDLAKTLTPKVYRVTDEQRQMLHVAAVFVNNFSNHLYHIASDILQKENLDFDILKPLILETALKVQHAEPKDMQTGPAARGDQQVIERHLKYLEEFPEYKKVYEVISGGIFK